jgi:hypothetical protein
LVSCSKKNFPNNSNADIDLLSQHTKLTVDDYTPPLVIVIADDLAKSNKEGEMYYDNEFGYRYWRNSDGKYYLDSKYERGVSPKKQNITKKIRKPDKKHEKEIQEIYANQ